MSHSRNYDEIGYDKIDDQKNFQNYALNLKTPSMSTPRFNWRRGGSINLMVGSLEEEQFMVF